MDLLHETRQILGLTSTSDAIREALSFLHAHAKEVDAAQQIRDFHRGERAPVDEVTAALYGPEAYPGRQA